MPPTVVMFPHFLKYRSFLCALIQLLNSPFYWNRFLNRFLVHMRCIY